MDEWEVGGKALENVHRASNDKKYYCHFTGFLEGIASSGYLEAGEIEPLIAECTEFVSRASDGDASKIIVEFEADLLEHDTISDAATYRQRAIDPTCEKSAVNRFLGFCRGIVCDGRITLAEAQAILAFLSDYPGLLAVVGVSQIRTTCADAVEDGIISAEESDEICEAIGHVVGDSYGDTGFSQVGGVANFEEFRLTDISIDLEGKIVVLTGTFKTTPRRHFEDELAALGAVIARHVSGKTDFLVVGGEASRDWIEMNRGTKMRKAQELRLMAERPGFVSEAQLLYLMSV